MSVPWCEDILRADQHMCHIGCRPTHACQYDCTADVKMARVSLSGTTEMWHAHKCTHTLPYDSNALCMMYYTHMTLTHEQGIFTVMGRITQLSWTCSKALACPRSFHLLHDSHEKRHEEECGSAAPLKTGVSSSAIVCR